MQNKVGSENVPDLEREKTEYQVITMHVTENSEKLCAWWIARDWNEGLRQGNVTIKYHSFFSPINATLKP